MSLGHLGYALVLVGVAAATFGAVVGLVGGLRRRPSTLRWAMGATIVFAGAMLAANLVMEVGLLTDDFSIRYVAQVGSIQTPTIYKMVSLWSALEGSILFWGLVLGGYLAAFAWLHRKEEPLYMSIALGVMLSVATFFAFLIAGPANPFEVLPNPPSNGPGPNPLLQNHVLMIIHPPMLYLGYVGMTVPFGVALAALIKGEIRTSWMGPLRRWTMVAWIFLTIGIVLGGWWAYAVLGWGGYWAWDPVENASFLPWLTATAFIHSTMVQERKKMLKLWTLSLALASFVLTILGTFMTRSGVFNSVHSFTQSDIGPTFLVFIGILLLVCIALLAVRGPLLVAEDHIKAPLSRETSILVNNLVFAALTFVVLVGTLHPLIAESLFDKRVSVGAPYFNRLTLPFWVAMLFLMGVGPMLPWGRADGTRFRNQFLVPGGAALLTVGVCLAFGLRGGYALAVFGLAAFVTVITLRELVLPVRARMRDKQEGFFQALTGSASRSQRRFGGYIVHLGIVLIAVAVAASSAFVSHTTATLRVGESFELQGHRMTFEGLVRGQEPHREYVAARLQLTPRGEDGQRLLAPRMNYYESSTDPVGTPAVHDTVREDLYISLLAFDGKSQVASFNAWTFPLVSWIWWSLPILAFGTLIAVWPLRRRKAAKAGTKAGGKDAGAGDGVSPPASSPTAEQGAA